MYNSSMRNWEAEVERWNLQHGAALDAEMFLCPAYIYFKTSNSQPNLQHRQAGSSCSGWQPDQTWNRHLEWGSSGYRNELALLLQHLDQFP